MKLSINWIFEHINLEQLDLKNINIQELIEQFSLTSVEIDNINCIDIDLDQFTLALVKSVDNSNNTAFFYSPELKKEIVLPFEKDIKLGSTYVLKKDKEHYIRATLGDLGANNLNNNKLLIAVDVKEEDLSGNWKKDFESKDYIIDVANIAITNRPDMWGHRGFAREFAAIINKKLIPEEHILAKKEISTSDTNYVDNNFSIEIKKENHEHIDYKYPCRRLAGLYFKDIENKSSSLKIATRLLRIDCKPFNMLVDLTNYVMFDLSQPLHAFDADTIKSKKIVARFAFNKEKLELLDKSEIILTPKDYVIADSEVPIALAGIKGGYKTAISDSTKSVFLESANFDPFVIRNTSINSRIRTEASSRFEKNLDPNQNTDAILRFLKLLDANKINYQADKYILSLGNIFDKKTIKISYNFILDKLGINKVDLPKEKIKDILSKLEFDVKIKDIKAEDINIEAEKENSNINFIIIVPTYRATKDITIKEDILKEIARFVGYSFIKPELPTKKTIESDISTVMQERDIKQHMAYAIGMHEVQTYAFFDQEFLNHIDYHPKDYLEIKNPQSQHYKILITTLVPNLLKCISVNLDKAESLRFFELNRIWFKQYGNTDGNPNDFISIEFLELSGLFFDNKNPHNSYNFYYYKAKLNSLFNFLGIQQDVEWKKFSGQDLKFCDKLYDCLETAELFYKGRSIGMFGKVNQYFLNKVTLGQAFAFELDANFLINVKEQEPEFRAISKYPESHFDISLLINQKVEVDTIIDLIKNTNNKIKQVDLIDMFHKKEWGKEKSLTFRLKIYDEHKTLIKEEITEIYSQVIKNLKDLGADIR